MSEAESYSKEEAMKLVEQAYHKQTEGKLQEAIALYRQSISLHPTAEAHTFLGWAYSLQQQYGEAIRECERAIAVDPDFGNPYNDIGAYLIETGHEEEALPWLEKATHAKRYDSYCYPHYNMGRVWEKKGDWQQALTCYRRSLEQDSKYRLAKRALNRIMSMLN